VKSRVVTALSLSTWLWLSSTSAAECPEKIILKTVEPVVFLDGKPQLQIPARIDTGATLSSLDTALARQLGLDQQPIREITVYNAHGSSRRKVVRLKFLLRGQVREAEFTLIARKELPHQILLGRQSLKGFLVDPSEP